MTRATRLLAGTLLGIIASVVYLFAMVDPLDTTTDQTAWIYQLLAVFILVLLGFWCITSPGLGRWLSSEEP